MASSTPTVIQKRPPVVQDRRKQDGVLAVVRPLAPPYHSPSRR